VEVCSGARPSFLVMKDLFIYYFFFQALEYTSHVPITYRKYYFTLYIYIYIYIYNKMQKGNFTILHKVLHLDMLGESTLHC